MYVLLYLGTSGKGKEVGVGMWFLVAGRQRQMFDVQAKLPRWVCT